MKTFSVNREQDWSGELRSLVNGEWVTMWTKEPVQPFATVTAPDLSAALALARRRYGSRIVVSEPMAPVNQTSYRGVA